MLIYGSLLVADEAADTAHILLRLLLFGDLAHLYVHLIWHEGQEVGEMAGVSDRRCLNHRESDAWAYSFVIRTCVLTVKKH